MEAGQALRHILRLEGEQKRLCELPPGFDMLDVGFVIIGGLDVEYPCVPCSIVLEEARVALSEQPKKKYICKHCKVEVVGKTNFHPVFGSQHKRSCPQEEAQLMFKKKEDGACRNHPRRYAAKQVITARGDLLQLCEKCVKKHNTPRRRGSAWTAPIMRAVRRVTPARWSA